MYCGLCGAKVSLNSDFCPNCGAQLIAPGQQAPGQQAAPPEGWRNNEGWQAQSNDWEQQQGRSANTGGSGIGGYLAERQQYVERGRQDRTRIMEDGSERTSWGVNASSSRTNENRVFMGGQSRYRAPEGKKADKLKSRNMPYTGYERYGVPQPGWSDRINDPEILAAIKKDRRIGSIAAIFIIPIPFICFLIAGALDKMEMGTAFGGGLFVSAVFFICMLAGRWQGSKARNYEGMVIDKYEQEERDKDSSSGHYTGRLIGVTVVRTTTGKEKKIKEAEGTGFAWDYLEIGAQFKYHAQLPGFPYERYDKAKYPYLYCCRCRTKNPIEEDRCMRCGLPLLK